MAGNIKGVVIEFQGDTSRLDKALRQVDNSTRKIDKELKNVNKALKFNPTSVDLWRQKQQLLSQKINETRTRLDVLKQAQKKMDAEGVDKNSEEYRKLQREIVETESKLKNFQAQQRKIGNVNLRAASEQFKEYGEKITAAGQAMKGVSMVAAGLVASLGAISYKAGQSADDLNTLSKVTGIGTGELQKYSYAADLVDVSVDAIAKSNKRLTKSAYSAANGSKSQSEAFEKLGVSVTDSEGNLRDSEAIFDDVIASLGKMTNETERDALAQQLMGKSAAELNPLIADGGETYKMVADTLKKYNLDYVDQETLDKANDFNDQLDTMKLLGKVALAQVGSQLAGQLAPALEKVVDLFGRFANWLGNLNPKILTVVGAIAGVLAVTAPLLIGLGKMSFAISSILGLMAKVSGAFGLFEAGIGAVLGPAAAIVAVIGVLIAAFKHLWDTNEEFRGKMTAIWNVLKQTVVVFIDQIATKFGELVALFTGGSGSIKAAWTAFCNYLAPMFEGAFSAIVIVVRTVLNTILGVLDVFIAVFKGDWGAAWTAIKSVFSTVWTGIFAFLRNIWTMIVNLVKLQLKVMLTVFKTIFNSIKSLVSTVWTAIKTKISQAIDGARTKVASAVTSIKTSVTTAFNGLKSTVASIWNGIKNAITSPIRTAVSTVKSLISKIKNVFPIKIGKLFSGLKLPHFSISKATKDFGKLGSITYPTGISVSWYKKAMQNPYMFSSPTLFGAGEAGDEILYGRNSLMRDISSAVSSANAGGGDEITINVYASQGMDVKELAAEVERRLIESQKRRKLAWQ